VGLGAAIEKATNSLEVNVAKVAALRDDFLEKVRVRIPHILINGAKKGSRLPSNANISFKYVEGESILLSLDEYGIATSSGSACSSGSLEPSHVLLAMGVPAAFAHGSIRFSFGKDNTQEDVDYTVEKLTETIERLRKLSPLFSYEKGEGKDVQ